MPQSRFKTILIIDLRHVIRFTQFVKTAIAVTALLAVVTVIVATEYSDLLHSRFVGQSTDVELFDVSSGRTEIWRMVLSKQGQTPISFVIGFGWAAYDAMRAMGEFRFATHSAYLAYLFDLGAIGLVLFLTLLLHIIRVTKKTIDISDDAVRALLMAFLFAFLSISVAIIFGNLHKPWLFIWAYTGLMMRLAVEASSKLRSSDTRGLR